MRNEQARIRYLRYSAVAACLLSLSLSAGVAAGGEPDARSLRALASDSGPVQAGQFPSPDLTALEPFFEIVKFRYHILGDDGKLYLTVKAKTDDRPKFQIRFYDEDGVQVSGGSFLIPVSGPGSAGDPETYAAYTPSEATMQRVKRVLFVRDTGYGGASVASNPQVERQAPLAGAAPERAYRVGSRVEYVDGGRWFKAIIVQVATDAEVADFGPYHVYLVHSLGYDDDAWVSGFADYRAQLRPAGSGKTEPVPGGEANDRVVRSLLAAAGSGAVQRQASAAGAGIPSGHYGCSFAGGGSPGYVDIRGGTYRGPSLTGAGAFAAYSMAGSAITWTGGFGEFTTVSSEFMGPDTAGRPWFAVTYSRTHGGGVDRLDCLRE